MKILQDIIIGGLEFLSGAIFQIDSITKGILIPRMTTTQRDAINSPANSLLIFNSTTNQYQYFNGNVWVGMALKNDIIPNSQLELMSANTIKLNNTNANANPIDYNLPLGTVLANVNGNIEGLILETTVDIRRTLTEGTYVYLNPLLTVNSSCLGCSWTQTTGHTSVPLSCLSANGSMTFTTGQVGDTAEFVAFIKF